MRYKLHRGVLVPVYGARTRCNLQSQLLASYGGAAAYVANAVDFDGTNDYLSKATVFTGGPTSGLFSISIWFRLDGGDGTTLDLACFQNSVTSRGFLMRRLTTNKIQVVFQDDTGAAGVLVVTSTSTYAAGATWHNVLFSADINQNVGAKSPLLYIDNASETNINTDSGTGGQLLWGSLVDTMSIAARVTSNKFNGCLAETWAAPGVQLDYSSSTIRAKFISGGKPVNLGTTGTIPATPLLYLPNVAASVGTNASTGGNFTINGAPAACSSAP